MEVPPADSFFAFSGFIAFFSFTTAALHFVPFYPPILDASRCTLHQLPAALLYALFPVPKALGIENFSISGTKIFVKIIA